MFVNMRYVAQEEMDRSALRHRLVAAHLDRSNGVVDELAVHSDRSAVSFVCCQNPNHCGSSQPETMHLPVQRDRNLSQALTASFHAESRQTLWQAPIHLGCTPPVPRPGPHSLLSFSPALLATMPRNRGATSQEHRNPVRPGSGVSALRRVGSAHAECAEAFSCACRPKSLIPLGPSNGGIDAFPGNAL